MKHLVATIAAVWIGANGAFAQEWTLDGSNSLLSYGSIKKDTVGEVNSFTSISGTVSSDGMVNIAVDLTSLETNIDIRNERMGEHVFNGATTAQLSAQVDMAELNSLGAGGSTTVFADVTLSLLGAEIPVEAELFVLRIDDTRVMVSTNAMVFLSTVDAGVDAGVTKLMEIAKLPGITRTVPVTLRLMFTQSGDSAAAMPAKTEEMTQTAMAGDAKAGRRVFAKCRACHKMEKGKNGSGPSLHKIIGASAGQVDGFRYSKAMAGSGVVWTQDALTEFLAKPNKFMPGNKMTFNGLRKPDDITNLLAYIAKNGGA